MPIYEYQCTNCDHKLECIQKIDDDPLLTCPKCDSDSLRKLMSAASFRLKGTGWYATDFKDQPKKPAGEKSTTTASTDTAKPEGKSSDTGSTEKKEVGGSTDKKEAGGNTV